MNLRSWLKKTPRPSFVLADDQLIEVPNNYRGINDLLATIQSLDPAKLTCLDKEKKIIRSKTLGDGDDDKKTESHASAEMSDLQLFAKLLAEGYEHGRKANQPIIDSAMQFVESQSVRLAKSEAEIERLRAHIHKLNLKIGELSLLPEAPAAGGDDSLMGAIVAGIAQGATGGSAVTPIIKGATKK